jgi:hypothetical protein
VTGGFFQVLSVLLDSAGSGQVGICAKSWENAVGERKCTSIRLKPIKTLGFGYVMSYVEDLANADGCVMIGGEYVRPPNAGFMEKDNAEEWHFVLEETKTWKSRQRKAIKNFNETKLQSTVSLSVGSLN